jgi:hypothetical protein
MRRPSLAFPSRDEGNDLHPRLCANDATATADSVSRYLPPRQLRAVLAFLPFDLTVKAFVRLCVRKVECCLAGQVRRRASDADAAWAVLRHAFRLPEAISAEYAD